MLTTPTNCNLYDASVFCCTKHNENKRKKACVYSNIKSQQLLFTFGNFLSWQKNTLRLSHNSCVKTLAVNVTKYVLTQNCESSRKKCLVTLFSWDTSDYQDISWFQCNLAELYLECYKIFIFNAPVVTDL